MTTVAQIAKASLQSILVQASEAPLEPDEYADYILALNSFMLSLDAQGIKLGFKEVSNLGDQVVVPPGAIRGIIANMAIEVAADYNGVISDSLKSVAAQGMQTMIHLGTVSLKTAMPPTLPVGSGNEDYNDSTNYYPGYSKPAQAKLELRNNTTETVFANAGEPAKVIGEWVVRVSDIFKSDSTGKVLYPVSDGFTLHILADFVSIKLLPANEEFDFFVAKNGLIIQNSRVTTKIGNIAPMDVSLSWVEKLQANDYIELYVLNRDSADSLLILDANLSLF